MRGVAASVTVVTTNGKAGWRGATVAGHPHHRIGDRYEDLKEMGHDVDNPAGV